MSAYERGGIVVAIVFGILIAATWVGLAIWWQFHDPNLTAAVVITIGVWILPSAVLGVLWAIDAPSERRRYGRDNE